MIIVTGVSSGIGKFLAQSLSDSGEEVIGLSRSLCSESYKTIQCDVAQVDQLRSVAKFIKEKKMTVDALINCAAVASMNMALTTPSETAEKMIKINLLGTIFTTQIFSPFMIKNKAGRIINFTSIATSLGLKGESIYAASKAGVESYSNILAKELSSFNVTVNCISPGPIRTRLISGIAEDKILEIINQQVINKMMNFEDIQNIVQFLLSEKSSAISGQVIHIGGV